MQEGRILFTIQLDYGRTSYKSLNDLAINHYWNRVTKKYDWTFFVKDVGAVSSAIGTPITFNQEEVNEVSLRSPGEAKIASIGSYKGKGEFSVFVYETIVRVYYWQNKKQHKKDLPVELVNKVWEAIRTQPIGKRVRTRTIAEHYCRLQNYVRFFRGDSNTFDFAKMFGTRKDYKPLNFSLQLPIIYLM